MIYRAFIFFVFFSVLSFSVCGQHFSVNNRFELDKIKGCAPLTVNVTAPECGSTSCNIDYGDGSGPQTFVSSHTFTNPGTFTIRIVFGASGSDLITVQILPDVQPEFEIYRCSGALNTIVVKITDTTNDNYTITYSDGASVLVPSGVGATNTHAFATPGLKTVSVKGRKLGFEDNCSPMVKSITIASTLIDGMFTQLEVLDDVSLNLDMTLEPFTQYRLEIATNNSATWQTFRNVYALSDLTVTGLRTDDNFYCFRLATFDPCSGTTTGYSDIICSSNFDVTAKNGANQIDWKTSATGITDYTISKTDLATPLPSLTATPPAATLDDVDVTCTITYYYQLTANYANGSTSISLVKEATAFSTTPPTAIQNITASVVNPGIVNLEWTQDPSFTPTGYDLFKTANGITRLIAQIPSTTYTDNEYNTLTPTCYKVKYTDVCGNNSPIAVEACPVQLSAIVNSDNTITLSWTPYQGWINGANSYTIEKYDADGQLIDTFTPGNTTTFLDNISDPDNQVYTYVVFAIANDPGLNQAASNIITVIKEPNLFYPTAFTPNGDDLNDIFKVFGQYVVKFEMKIFNRWGELVFATDDLTAGWDGSFKGNPMPEGTYAFVAKITDLAGRTFDRSGSVLLIKKN